MSSDPGYGTVGEFRSALRVAGETSHEGDARGRRDDDRLARAWGIGTCDVYGRTIVLGEESAYLSNRGHVVEVCSTCQLDVTARGYRRAA